MSLGLKPGEEQRQVQTMFRTRRYRERPYHPAGQSIARLLELDPPSRRSLVSLG